MLRPGVEVIDQLDGYLKAWLLGGNTTVRWAKSDP